ncbi:MAG: methionyl-tRNA formyltransferase [Geitlerinemataceae cyanobacterium]
MKIIFFGTPQFAVPTLERLLETPDFEVVAVVTQPDKRRGRGANLIPSPVKTVAVAQEIPVWQPRRVKKDADTLEKLRSANADAFVVVAYGQILSPEILAMPKLGCINGHGSILPKYRGAAPIQWCLHDGETRSGMTTMLMDAGMDTGAMLLIGEVDIDLLENAWDLAAKLAELGADLMVETLLKLRLQEIQPIAQDNDRATYAPLIQKEDYRLDWSKSAIDLHNQIRGFYPNCLAEFRGKSIKILATVPLDVAVWEQLPAEFVPLKSDWEKLENSVGKPGEVAGIVKKFGAIVRSGEGFLLLREVQLSGKKVQSGGDFANGTRLEVGEGFS